MMMMMMTIYSKAAHDTATTITQIIVHSKYFPDSDWLKAHV